MVTAALIVLASVVFFRPAQIASIFAKVLSCDSIDKILHIKNQDPTFIDRVAEARLPLAALVLTMNLTVALEVHQEFLQNNFKTSFLLFWKSVLTILKKLLQGSLE